MGLLVVLGGLFILGGSKSCAKDGVNVDVVVTVELAGLMTRISFWAAMPSSSMVIPVIDVRTSMFAGEGDLTIDIDKRIVPFNVRGRLAEKVLGFTRLNWYTPLDVCGSRAHFHAARACSLC